MEMALGLSHHRKVSGSEGLIKPKGEESDTHRNSNP
jgi:hypothetical protein